jgi:hypothetical protein
MHHRWITIAVTVAALALSLFGMNFVQQQFFPSSDHAELAIDWNLPHNASIEQTDVQTARFEREQLQGNRSLRPCRSSRSPILQRRSAIFFAPAGLHCALVGCLPALTEWIRHSAPMRRQSGQSERKVRRAAC